ncbi:MAG: TadE/TadG family type IV pilus assembly protein [Panacagrimonas sp.]
MNPSSHSTGNHALQWQRGVYAVEYALVFPVFFLLLYGTLAYGMIFTMRLSLQHAAEEGARAALRYQPQIQSSPENQLVLRQNKAEEIAATQTQWLSSLGAPVIVASVCPIGQNCPQSPSEDGTPPAVPVCGEDIGTTCQVVVTVTYDYQANPVFPSLPGLDLIFPDNLQGRARVLLDGRALSL